MNASYILKNCKLYLNQYPVYSSLPSCKFTEYLTNHKLFIYIQQGGLRDQETIQPLSYFRVPAGWQLLIVSCRQLKVVQNRKYTFHMLAAH